MSWQNRSRRDFLRDIARLLTTGGTLAISGEAFEAIARLDSASKRTAAQAAGDATVASNRLELPYSVAQWTGDDFTRGHRMRDGELPEFPKASEKKVEFVIIGGGISGLASAHYLRDHDYLLIEQYNELGGQSRGGTFRGIDYSLGAAYIGSSGGEIGALLDDLDLHPVKLGEDKDAWRYDNRWSKGLKESKGQSGSGKLDRSLKEIIEQAKPVWKNLPEGLPPIPTTSPELLALDRAGFDSYFKGADRQFIKLYDSYCRAANCAGVEGMSALAGLVLAADLVEPSYVLEGGNSKIARTLAERLDRKRWASGFVWSVEPKGKGASVVYTDEHDVTHRVDCDHVVVAVPFMVAGRILQGLDQGMKTDLLSFQYGSYLVANLLSRKRVFDVAYDNFCAPPFTFSDITQADTPYVMANKYKETMGSVLTVYQPYDAGAAGRATLLSADRLSMADGIVKQIEELAGGFTDELESVVLTRWGHAMAVTEPGYFEKISRLHKNGKDWFTLAHSSSQGPPCVEAAVNGARYATNRALGIERG